MNNQKQHKKGTSKGPRHINTEAEYHIDKITLVMENNITMQ